MFSILPGLILLSLFVVALLVRRAMLVRSRIAEPSCGRCGYCVRGLESMICPECGSDLRKVGILTPGTLKPPGRSEQLLRWMGVALGLSLGAGGAAAQWLAPWQAVSTSQRMISVHLPYLSTTIRAQLKGQKLVLGRPFPPPKAPMQELTLSLMPGGSGGVMTISLPDRHLIGARGNRISASLDAAGIAAWLNANGYNDPRVAEQSGALLTCINELVDQRRTGFTFLDKSPGGAAQIVAHPITTVWTTLHSTDLTRIVPWAIGATTWLLTMSCVLVARRIQFRADADQERIDSRTDRT
jgi:hypothetical protein